MRISDWSSDVCSSDLEMTGLLNRRGFGLELSRALARARRQNESGLLVMCDLDNFKAINDTYGHPAGDAILRAVGKALKRNTRESDYVARVGGDEFAVIMTHASLPQSAQLAEKLSGRVNGQNGRESCRERVGH